MALRVGCAKPLAVAGALAWAICASAVCADADPTPAPSAAPSPAPSPTATASSTSEPESSANFGGPGKPSLWYSIENEDSPNFTGESGSASQINLRAQIPLGNFAQRLPNPLLAPMPYELIKLKLPIVLSATDDSEQGYGDTTLVMLEYLGRKTRRWVVGPSFKLPTASTSDLGSGKWSVGPAVGYTAINGNIEVGAYSQNFFSFAGPKALPRVSQSQIQPDYTISVGHGWSIGTSQMQFSYNWRTNQWTAVPLGVRFADTFQSRSAKLTAGFEIEKDLLHEVDTPGWTVRLNLKWQPRSG